jgi:hypothetical protein
MAGAPQDFGERPSNQRFIVNNQDRQGLRSRFRQWNNSGPMRGFTQTRQAPEVGDWEIWAHDCVGPIWGGQTSRTIPGEGLLVDGLADALTGLALLFYGI